MRIRNLFDPESRIRDGKIRIRDKRPDPQHWFKPNIIHDVSYSSGKIMAVLQIQSILVR
jgi:hypothetical protein